MKKLNKKSMITLLKLIEMIVILRKNQ